MRWRPLSSAVFMFLLIGITAVPPVKGGDLKPVRPSARDKCVVCGMFVAKYPDFAAQIVFKDGSRFFFDGAKDMFKFYLDLKKYAPSRNKEDVEAVFVTDYYTLGVIDGMTAWYVAGSDVYGPMGKELIPAGSEVAAKEFMRDHKGKNVLKFRQVTRELLKGLD